MTKEEIREIVAEMLDERTDSKPVPSMEQQAIEIMQRIDLYMPLVEAYGKVIIRKTAPAIRELQAEAAKELLPCLLPIVRAEARVIAEEMCSVFFGQLQTLIEGERNAMKAAWGKPE